MFKIAIHIYVNDKLLKCYNLILSNGNKCKMSKEKQSSNLKEFAWNNNLLSKVVPAGTYYIFCKFVMSPYQGVCKT